MPLDGSEINAGALADFGVPVIINFIEYRAIYQEPGKVQSVYDGSIQTTAPTISMSADDVTAADIRTETIVTIGGVDYQVAAPPEPDGLGFCNIMLTKDF